VAPLSLLVPVIGLLSAMLLLGEFPTALQWLGTAGVLLGMVVNQFGGNGCGAERAGRHRPPPAGRGKRPHRQ
jgi:drug/metabolite transporter (DMT)-like permease